MEQEKGSIFWRRDNVVPVVPEEVTQWNVFSYCGKLTGHYPVCGWLRMTTAFIERKVNNLTERWDDAVADKDLRRLLEKVDMEVRKHDPARGKWSVIGDKARVWGGASSLATGFAVEVDGCITKDASWLRKDTATHINMAELDSVIAGLKMGLAWKFKRVELHVHRLLHGTSLNY